MSDQARVGARITLIMPGGNHTTTYVGAEDYDALLAEKERLEEALPTAAEIRRLKEHAEALCGRRFGAITKQRRAADRTRWGAHGQHIFAIAERLEARAVLSEEQE